MTPEDALCQFIAEYPDQEALWIGFSGGLDSRVLLHLLASVKPAVPVRVIHVNHRLSPRADAWQAFCQQTAQDYGFEFMAEAVVVEPDRRGTESAARDARYQAFARHLGSGEMLLLAHHADDQAETLLLRLLRGTGLRGLGAMAPVRPLRAGVVGRPLLNFSREQLLAYARAQGLQWVEDESNSRADFDRNFIRLEVMPRLAQRWPAFTGRWSHTAALARENEQLLQDYARADLQSVGCRTERLGQSIKLKALTELSPARRRALLRFWVDSAGYRLPERAHLDLLEDFLAAADDAQPQLAWDGCELRRFAGRLYRLPRLAPAHADDAFWDPRQPLSLPDGSRLLATPAAAGLDPDRCYSVRLRQGGERCRPHGRRHSQKLKKLLQEYALEPWLRDRVPLVYCGDDLAAVGDLWVCEEFYLEGEGALTLEWRVV